jgi:hypothetical protein
MGQTPSANRLLKAAAIGVGLAVLGIVLFLVIYFSLSGVSALARLLVAMCLPPLLIGVLVGGYALATGRLSPERISKKSPRP